MKRWFDANVFVYVLAVVLQESSVAHSSTTKKNCWRNTNNYKVQMNILIH